MCVQRAGTTTKDILINGSESSSQWFEVMENLVPTLNGKKEESKPFPLGCHSLGNILVQSS